MEPDANSNQRREIQASEILAKIEEGETVKYNGEIIEGDLDLSGLDLLTEHVERTEFEIKVLGLTEEVKVVESPISITNSEIQGNVSFGNTIFRESIDFRGTNFSGDYANFSRAQFSGTANFYEAKFRGGDANFYGAQFSGSAYFSWTQFRGGDANFYGAQFSGYAEFYGAKFRGGDAIFSWTQFRGGDANFRGAQFSGDAYFFWAQFSGGAYFHGAQFSDHRNSASNFERARFGGVTSFVDAQFSPYTDFRAVQFNNSLDLTHARFDLLEIEWGSIHHLNCDETAYIALVRNFRDLAQFDDADACYYQYRKESQDRNEWDSGENWSKVLDIIAWISCGYGVRPIHTIFCMLGVVVISWIIFFGYFDSMFESFYFSLMTFTGGKPDNLEPVRWLRSVAMIEAILGYLFMALFVVVLARKLIR